MVYITSSGAVAAKKVTPWYMVPVVVLLFIVELLGSFFGSLFAASEKKGAGAHGGVVKRGGRYAADKPKPADPNIRGVKDIGAPACSVSGG